MPVGAAGGKTKRSKYVIDVSAAAKDNVLKAGDFEDFLTKAIKVGGKTGNLTGGGVVVARDGNKITVTSDVAFAKRYFKYLTKKYLKKNELRQYLRVVASSKTAYELRYFRLDNEEGDDDEE